MSLTKLKKNFEWYLAHQSELVKRYNGRVLAIKGCVVFGDFDSDGEAVNKIGRKHEMGTFILQRCSPGDQDYTAHFYTPRVHFTGV